MSRGYVLIARGLLDHPRFKPRGPFTAFEAWNWLIASAAYAPRDVTVISGRNRTTVRLEPGQLTYSIRYLANAWQWSDKRVQRFLSAIESDHSVTTQTTTGQTVVTLCNWAKYQRPDFEATTQSATPTTTNKKEIKEKKERARKSAVVPEGFDDWFAIYQRAIERPAAERNFRKVMKSGAVSLDDLMAATARYAAKIEAGKPSSTDYIKKPANWLRDGGYDDGQRSEPRPLPIDPSAFSDEQWRKRLACFRNEKTWLDWGPEPGKPGCLVPSHLLLTPVSSSKGAA
jgi:hypothetical protein